jgi:hypothetical protein
MSEPFHDAFERALHGDISALDPWSSDPASGRNGLQVYRNTTAKGLADAVIAQFPSVTSVTGEAWMAAAARTFCAAHPPTSPPLATYGQGFADWLEGPAREQDLAYLPDLARLDRLWTECHTAADDPVLSPGALQDLAPEDFLAFRLAPRASSRWATFAWAVPTLWQALRRDPGLEAFDLEDRAETLLLTRPNLEVEFAVISPGAGAFLTACREGQSMAAAAQEALGVEADLNLQSTFAALVAAGVFTHLQEITP